MVLKRHLREGGGGEDGSEFPGRDFKRRPAFAFAYASILRNVNRNSLHDLGPVLEPSIRTWVREEVQRAISSIFRPSSLAQISSPESRIFQLHFEDPLPSVIFTGCRLESEEGSRVKIVLRDSSSRKIITTGSLSSSKVNILVLDGDFNIEDRDDWGEEEFNRKCLREREGKRPLVTGILSIVLEKGVGYVDDITFTDNSSWVRCGKFRLGAKLHNITGEGVREGISNAFKVKDHRGESYKKHHPPRTFDEVWRLEKIAKEGASHKRLAGNGINTVKDFLRLYVTKSRHLRHILGGKISNKSWDAIIGHAVECQLDKNELYMYNAEDGTALVFDSIYRVVGAIFYGQNYQTRDTFNLFQKKSVENLKLRAYENVNQLVPISDQSLITRPLLLSSLQASSDSNPSSSLQRVNFPVEQDEVEFHMNTNARAYGVQYGNQFQVPVADTSHQMEEFSSMSSNGFAINDSYAGLQTVATGWDNTFSPAPLGSTDPVAFNENYQVDTPPAWQGNSFFVAPRNQALVVSASNLGIRFSGIAKSKASWCKIRAIIKWRMVKSCSKKNGISSKFRL